jgi:hypothetical protein
MTAHNSEGLQDYQLWAVIDRPYIRYPAYSFEYTLLYLNNRH